MIDPRLQPRFAVVVIEVTTLDEFAVTGEWCEHCMLPSGVRVPLVAVDHLSLAVVDRALLTFCEDCGCGWVSKT